MDNIDPDKQNIHGVHEDEYVMLCMLISVFSHMLQQRNDETQLPV